MYHYGYSYEENYVPPKDEINNEETKRTIKQLKQQSYIARFMQIICCYTGIGKDSKLLAEQ